MLHRRASVRAAAAMAVLLASGLVDPCRHCGGRWIERRASDRRDDAACRRRGRRRRVEEVVADAPSDSGEWGPLLDWGVQAKHMVHAVDRQGPRLVDG